MTEGLSQENKLAATSCVRDEISRISRAWAKVRFLDEQYPTLPVGNYWDTIRRVHDEMGAMISTWDKTGDKSDE